MRRCVVAVETKRIMSVWPRNIVGLRKTIVKHRAQLYFEPVLCFPYSASSIHVCGVTAVATDIKLYLYIRDHSPVTLSTLHYWYEQVCLLQFTAVRIFMVADIQWLTVHVCAAWRDRAVLIFIH